MFRLLIVDDEPMIRKGLVKLVEQMSTISIVVNTAENGVEALEFMERDCPHFLFTDIRMPKMDGLELCRQVSQLYPHVQIVVISGYSDFEYAQKSLSYGVKEYLLKPVNKKSIHEVLEKLVKHRHKQSSQSYISLSKMELWVESMEEAIWATNMEKMDALIAECRRECIENSIPFSQQIEFYDQFLILLVKKLNARDIFRFQIEHASQVPSSAEEAFNHFVYEVRQFLRVLKAKRKGNAKDPVEEAKSYIEKHLSKDVSLEEVAEVLGLNPSYFSQLFKQLAGETFVQYRIKRRMEKAKKLLENPSYRITDISYEVGYADHPHFTKTFKKYSGYSPSEYREKLGIQ